MKTDSIFYRLFQEYPAAFFEMLGQSAQTAQHYTFASVEVKQTAFRMDGVFASTTPEYPTYFVEVQFQEDQRFFERAIPEVMIYLSQTETVMDWRLVIWVARENLLPPLPQKYQALAPQILTFSLRRLPDSPSLGLKMVGLIVCPNAQASERVDSLKAQVQTLAEPSLREQMINLMETILAYKFHHLSRKELAAMFGLSELRGTRIYQDIKEEVEAIITEKVLTEGIERGRQEGLQRGRQEGLQVGQQEGIRLGEARLLLRQLSRRFGELSAPQQDQILALSLENLESLGDSLLDFQSIDDLQSWLHGMPEK